MFMNENQLSLTIKEMIANFDMRGIKKYTVIIILFVLMALFSLVSPYFLTWRNLSNIITQNTYFIIVAIIR